VLVIQAAAYNTSRLATVLAAVITSNTALAGMPGNVFLSASASGLPRDSVVNVTALVTLNKSDLLPEPVTHVPDALLHDVELGLLRVLGLRQSRQSAPRSEIRLEPEEHTGRPGAVGRERSGVPSIPSKSAERRPLALARSLGEDQLESGFGIVNDQRHHRYSFHSIGSVHRLLDVLYRRRLQCGQFFPRERRPCSV